MLRCAEEEPIVPEHDAPTTLMQWAVLILNTPNPKLKVPLITYPLGHTLIVAESWILRSSELGMQCTCSVPDSSSRLATVPRVPPDPPTFRRARRLLREIPLIPAK